MFEIQVRFDNYGSPYSYLTEDHSVKVADEVVVITPNGTKVATVVRVNSETGKATKPIVCKVDKGAYTQTLARIQKKAELDVQIKKRVKELTEGAMLKLLAQTDPELASLLKAKESI